MTDLSNHDKHDLDSIAALASGESNPLVEAVLASCSKCRAEFEMQEQVRAWLTAAATITMADHEREALHHRVESQIDQLELDQHGLGAVERRRWRGQPTAWILRIGTVGAALAVLAGVTGVLGRLGTNGGPGGFAATTAVAAESMIPPADDGDLTEGAGASAASETSAGMLAAQAGSQPRVLPGGDAEAVREEAKMLADETQAESADERVAAPPCADQIEGLNPLSWAESKLDGQPIVIIIVEGDEEPKAVVYRLADCELVEL